MGSSYSGPDKHTVFFSAETGDRWQRAEAKKQKKIPWRLPRRGWGEAGHSPASSSQGTLELVHGSGWLGEQED